jgi:16S rRNA (cytidine1402-2'-O)-methyltransferase
MALFVVATPIGNPGDITTRALELLRSADLIIGEELKVLRQQLKSAGVQGTTLEQLNEHSREADIEHFVNEAKTKNVVLVSDCGTPGFCDPGADLVAACAKQKVAVHPVPGASSLMSLLSVCGVRLDTFVFHGFLPAKNELREATLKQLEKERRPFIVMETPYRCEKLIEDLAKNFANRRIVVGLNLTQENERVLRVRAKELPALGPFPDAEPIVLVLPD